MTFLEIEGLGMALYMFKTVWKLNVYFHYYVDIEITHRNTQKDEDENSTG